MSEENKKDITFGEFKNSLQKLDIPDDKPMSKILILVENGELVVGFIDE